MEKIIYEHFQRSPNSIAVEDRDLSLSYAELLAEAAHLAGTLGVVVSGELIGILLGPVIHQIVAQLAIRLAGGTCVPIEPSLPKSRIAALLGDIRVRRVFVDKEDSAHWDDIEVIHVQPISGRKNVDLAPETFESKSEISHILFTSGSTGKPKPVQIRAESILHMATKTLATPLQTNDRVTEFNNPGFDIMLFDIWVTLISGATIVVVPREIATDPGAFGGFLKSHNATVTFLTAALFQIIAFTDPFAFSSLRHVFTGGDVASVHAMRSVLENGPPQNLWNSYGPTECTTMVTMARITLEETSRERITVGRPIGSTVLVLLDEDQNTIRDSGRRGEIHIGGPQQAFGYLNMPYETDQFFIHLEKKKIGLPGEGSIRLYRTGDMAEWRDTTYLLDFIGRTDNQVKHAGFRVDLGEIEHALLTHRGVQSVVVVRQPPISESGTHSLVAFVVGTEVFHTQNLLEFAREHLPAYMVPNAVERITEFPLTPNGKVDRNTLVQRRLETLRQELSVPEHKSEDNRALLRGLWEDLLNVANIGDEDDFFVSGGSSLQAAALISLIRKRLGTLVSMQDLHTHSTLDRLLRLIENTDLKHEDAPNDAKIWMEDVNLVNDIELVPRWEDDTEGRVFVTGVTGFVGAHLLQRLMEKPSVKQIACLARPTNGVSAATRVQQALERYDLWPSRFDQIQKLLVLEGDLGDRELGLGSQKFTWLANWASVIFHLGAKVNFCQSYREHRVSNVVGTCNALRLASSGRRKSFHYVSSIDVWGPTGYILGTKELYEDEPLERHIEGLRYDLGYAQSQWTAEAMVRRMRDRGLPITIYRPGFIVGDSKTGTNNPDDFFSRFLAGCIQLGTFPRILEQRLEYVTVDYVLDALIHIASDNKNLGMSYSLNCPDVRQSVDVIGTCAVLNEAGYDVKVISYDEWVEQLRQQPEDGPLAPLMPMLQEKVLGLLTRWEASQYSPVYRCDNTTEALKDNPGIKYTPFDTALLKRFIGFWNRKGFYHIRE
ncbi:Male sterility, NAD-binding [Penicillium griseofulvum]|uniref:Male sterility, NAD-binding n=1 Tax=Penicillium patulum TaxID=5078 RepID=A0A135LT24_PENPA|nr:Male sterility, NAD-binding [Penicillium griseofulvum]KXG52110.1 Male sterility, NAD-binding [Penicillium griseofulvum]